MAKTNSFRFFLLLLVLVLALISPISAPTTTSSFSSTLLNSAPREQESGQEQEEAILIEFDDENIEAQLTHASFIDMDDLINGPEAMPPLSTIRIPSFSNPASSASLSPDSLHCADLTRSKIEKEADILFYHKHPHKKTSVSPSCSDHRAINHAHPNYYDQHSNPNGASFLWRLSFPRTASTSLYRALEKAAAQDPMTRLYDILDNGTDDDNNNDDGDEQEQCKHLCWTPGCSFSGSNSGSSSYLQSVDTSHLTGILSKSDLFQTVADNQVPELAKNLTLRMYTAVKDTLPLSMPRYVTDMMGRLEMYLKKENPLRHHDWNSKMHWLSLTWPPPLSPSESESESSESESVSSSTIPKDAVEPPLMLGAVFLRDPGQYATRVWSDTVDRYGDGIVGFMYDPPFTQHHPGIQADQITKAEYFEKAHHRWNWFTRGIIGNHTSGSILNLRASASPISRQMAEAMNDENSIDFQSNVALAKGRIHDLHFLGIFDRFSESMELFAFSYCISLSKLEMNEKKLTDDNLWRVRREMEDDARAVFNQRNKMDLALFAYAEALFDARLQRMKQAKQAGYKCLLPHHDCGLQCIN